jgi:nickel/cobalt transporter (NicO) family protein
MRLAKLTAGLALLAAWLVPTVASAHPLGNFTVNHYSRIEPSADHVRVVYVLDMAEIPTFQEKPRIDPNPEAYADLRAEELRQNLHLELNGQPAPLHVEHRALSFPDGAGGLSTLRLEVVYAADVSANPSSTVNLTYRDDNDPTHIGWREIVARPGAAGTQIASSSVPANDVTNELRTYPEDLLNSPLNVRQASVSFVPGLRAATSTDSVSAAASAAAMRPMVPSTGVGILDRANTAFADLANGGELTPTFILFAVGVAIVLGAAHALQPGHGKTIVAAYLVGSRGTARHALFLGGTVTATHTAGVYALGIVTLFLSQYIVPERLYPVLETASGLLVVVIGVWLFGQRLLVAVGLRPAPGHGHSHSHSHDHSAEDAHADTHSHLEHSHAAEQAHAATHAAEHDHAATHAHASSHTALLDGSPARSGAHAATGSHSHGHGPAHSHAPASGERVSWKSLLALGVSGGLLPCPEALMVLLITIAAHRVLFGLLLIVSFSTGLAAVLVGFGLLLIYARGFFGRINLSTGLVPRLLPVASALVIVIAGGVITAQALPQVL